MCRIYTFLTSLLVLVNIFGIKTFLAVIVVWRSVICIILVTGWSRLHKRLPLLVFTCWEICVLMSHRLICAAWGSLTTCFICLLVAFELSIFLASCLTLLVGNLSRCMLLSFIVLETNSLSLRKNQNISVKYLGCFLRVLKPKQPESGQHYTIPPLTCFLARSLQGDQTWPSLHFTETCRILQICPKWYQALTF